MQDNNKGSKGILQGMGGWSQFFFLCFLFFSGLTMGTFVLIAVMDIDSIQRSADSMRMAQAIQTLFIFLLPALAFAKLCQTNPKEYLHIDTLQSRFIIISALLFIITVQPFINCISYYNHLIQLPESMAGLETWVKESEASAEKTINLLFSDLSVYSLIFNILVIAVLAGLAEEFFFRGCLQQIIGKIVINRHATVWITAIIFSAVHFQFYGFIPRVILGAFLGYLFMWSANIWVPVLAHTLHNAVNVILIHFYKYNNISDSEVAASYSFANNSALIIISSILSVCILIFIYKKRVNNLSSVE